MKKQMFKGGQFFFYTFYKDNEGLKDTEDKNSVI